MKFIKAHEALDNDDGDTNASFNRVCCFHMQQIFWFMFIYQSLYAIDQTNEMVAQMMSVDKGALGMFFELNTLVGIMLTIYISYFIVGVPHLKFGAKDKMSD